MPVSQCAGAGSGRGALSRGAMPYRTRPREGRERGQERGEERGQERGEAHCAPQVPGGRTKDGVMQFASPRVRAKFSKYVGVQEWRNAVFLMFNVVCGNAYGNTFIDKGGDPKP